jgi:hypothetical protein
MRWQQSWNMVGEGWRGWSTISGIGGFQVTFSLWFMVVHRHTHKTLTVDPSLPLQHLATPSHFIQVTVAILSYHYVPKEWKNKESVESPCVIDRLCLFKNKKQKKKKKKTLKPRSFLSQNTQRQTDLLISRRGGYVVLLTTLADSITFVSQLPSAVASPKLQSGRLRYFHGRWTFCKASKIVTMMW